MAEFKMFAAGVDNGSHFNMNVNSLSFGWKNMWQIEPEFGKSIGSPWNVRTSSARYNGYEAPTATINGEIDTSLTSLASSAGGSLLITLPRLGSMTLQGSAYVLYPALSDFLGSPFSNYLTGSIPCTIIAPSFTMDNGYQKAGSEFYIMYTMQLRLVSGPI